jgi:hypothetical protein
MKATGEQEKHGGENREHAHDGVAVSRETLSFLWRSAF